MRWKQPGRQIPWGYHRIWLVEHHMASSEASAHPELLIAAAAAQTPVIRLGSGAVLMNHYSHFQLAGIFKSLEDMYHRAVARRVWTECVHTCIFMRSQAKYTKNMK